MKRIIKTFIEIERGCLELATRNVIEDEHFKVIDVIHNWWGGSQMTHLLPRIFFEHFQSTSFVIFGSIAVAFWLAGIDGRIEE